MNETRFDLVVVGGGSGGYAAARTARALGATVAIVDHGPLGGLCILRGCMPSKTLLATSDLLGELAEAAELGVRVVPATVDMHHIIARKRRVIEGFATDRREALESYPLFRGQAQFESPSRVRVRGDGGEHVLEAKAFVIATGSVVAPPDFPGLAETGFVDSDVVLDEERLPGSAIVLGGGYVGCELGQFLARAGVKTTFIVRARHLLSREDADVGDAVTRYFREEGIAVSTEAQVTGVERRGTKKVVHVKRLAEPEEFEADEIFYALGRVPNVAGLGLERAGVTVHPMTGIEIDGELRTKAQNIFAVGDVTGPYQLVHVAIYQGEIAARNAVLGTHDRADYTLQKTHTIFTDPQVAVAGATEKELEARGVEYVKGSYTFADHGKAIAINKIKGFVKMLGDPRDGRLLGAAIVGPQASELIHEVIVAMYYGSTADEFMRIPHLHPTLAEILTYPAELIAEQVAASSRVAATAG